jgi:hypothetical protein
MEGACGGGAGLAFALARPILSGGVVVLRGRQIVPPVAPVERSRVRIPWGPIFDLHSFLAGTIAISGRVLRWLRIHHGHVLLPNAQVGPDFQYTTHSTFAHVATTSP